MTEKYTASNTFASELPEDSDLITMFYAANEVLGSDLPDEMIVSGGWNMTTLEQIRMSTSVAFGMDFESNIDSNDYKDGKAITEATFVNEGTKTTKYVKMITSSKLVGDTWHINTELYC